MIDSKPALENKALKQVLPIKKSADFQKIGKTSSKFHSHSITLLATQSLVSSQDLPPHKAATLSENFCRIGFTIAKSVSKSAVKRNKAKRRLREIARRLLPLLGKNHFDYVAIARREILNHDFKKIAGDFEFCLRKIHLPRQPKPPSKIS